jgi:uncharacterized damage-inducible protein DinB
MDNPLPSHSLPEPRSEPSTETRPEPWLRGTLAEVPAVVRAVLHSLELAKEDVRRWCEPLGFDELEARPYGLPSVGFQLRHIARSLDRLLTYAEGGALSKKQVSELQSEMESSGEREDLFREIETALRHSAVRVGALRDKNPEEARTVGKLKLPSSTGGLLVHIAEHTQRHVGQAVTTAKLLVATRVQDPLNGI